MQVTETLTDGLKREFRIVIRGHRSRRSGCPCGSRIIKGRVNLKGFRPGKVPVAFLKKTYGKSLMGEIVEQAMSESTAEDAHRPRAEAGLPSRSSSSRARSKPWSASGGDLAFKVEVELVPEFELADLSKLKLERPVADVERQKSRRCSSGSRGQPHLCSQRRRRRGREGDALTSISWARSTASPSRAARAKMSVSCSAKVNSFRASRKGSKAPRRARSERFNVRFPDDYSVERLKGKDAAFDVTVHEVRAPQEVEIDDAFAERFGAGSLDKLTQALRERIAGEYKRRSREHLKRRLLDALDARHSFALPQGLVESEFNQIWAQLQHAIEHGHPPEEDVGKGEDELKAEYRKIAERRVRLGLVLAEVGRTNKITITDEEINRAIGEEARRFPGQERKVYQHYQENPQAMAALRAPLYEDKVVDFVFELAEVTERKVSKEELMRDPETGPAETHDHDHDHDHDHEKKAKRARGKEPEKKEPAKKEPEKKTEAQKPAKARAKPAEKKEEKAPAKAAKPAKGAGKKTKS